MYTSTIHELGDEALLSLATWWYNHKFLSLDEVVEHMKTDSHMVQEGWDTKIKDTKGSFLCR